MGTFPLCMIGVQASNWPCFGKSLMLPSYLLDFSMFYLHGLDRQLKCQFYFRNAPPVVPPAGNTVSGSSRGPRLISAGTHQESACVPSPQSPHRECGNFDRSQRDQFLIHRNRFWNIIIVWRFDSRLCASVRSIRLMKYRIQIEKMK